MLGVRSYFPLKSLALVPLLGALSCSGPKGDTGARGEIGGGCTVLSSADGGKVISCADGTSVTIKDGSNGKDGTNGTNGTNGASGDAGLDGQPGADGKDGTSCSVTDNGNGTKTIRCTDGTSATVTDGKDGKDGKDGNSCTVTTDVAAGTSTITCTDGTSAVVKNGENGDPGRSCTLQVVTATSRKIICDDGTAVTINDGLNGTNGANGTNVEILSHHGRAFLAADRLATSGKYRADLSVTSVTADAAGTVTVNFTVKNAQNSPVAGLHGMSFAIASLAPAPTALQPNSWVPYLQKKEVATGQATGGWPMPDGTEANQGNRENNGTLTDHGDGTYTYVFKNKLVGLTQPSGGAAIPYVRSRLHRVAVMMGGASGPTASTTFDFVPDGSPATETRDVIATASCQACHGPDFAAHGKDRVTVETCTVCHAPGMTDAQSGNSLDLRTLIHKIHAGAENASAPGADGVFFDDPATAADESADNKPYILWGYNNEKHVFSGGFPAVLENCTKCHTGTPANVDNWKTKPSLAACTSCHDNVAFVNVNMGETVPAGMVAHAGGRQTDAYCSACHVPSGAVNLPYAPIETVHQFTTKDVRNIPEFSISLTMSTPGNGQYYVAGEAPLATIVITDAESNTPIDHTTFVEEAAADAEDCTEAACSPRDGKFTNSGFFVHGPRAHNSPVLSMAARVQVASATAGPWDLSALSASTATLVLLVDGGEDVYTPGAGGLVTVSPGTLTVKATSAVVGAGKTAVTAANLAAWLNADANFKRRAFAYVGDDVTQPRNQDGSWPSDNKLHIRSRNKGKFFGIQLQTSALNTAVFGNNTTAVGLGASTAKNILAKRLPASAAAQDPKVTYYTDKITYQLDPVDDLVAGTYVANVEFQDRGVKSSPTSYRIPSIARVTFQVGQQAEEKPIAGNCNSCHQNSQGEGLVFDPIRHNKHFDFNATDQCTACHDYQNQYATGGWSGAVPITRRVHAVHNGANLQFPDLTVGHADEPAGRHWQIEFPQDVRNCQACHPDGQVSGSWQHNPSRFACGACHDSLTAQNHIKIMTWDPTPANPYSGDEGESCAACHK